MTYFWWLLLAWLFVNLADIITTKLILEKGGIELLPLAAKAMKKWGIIPGLLITKGIGSIVVFAPFFFLKGPLELFVIFFIGVIFDAAMRNFLVLRRS